jgi:fibronectin-binding autotransporter adhesin
MRDAPLSAAKTSRFATYIVLAWGTALLLLPQAIQAATIVVDESTCTLTDAILAANTDTATGGCASGAGADTIELVTDVVLTTIYASTPSLGDIGLPILSSEITLRGAGHTITRDPGAPSFRLMLSSSSAPQRLEQVALSQGSTDGRGGAIYNDAGDLTLVMVTVSGNSGVRGGGIANEATLYLERSSVTDNTATIDGGGIWNNGVLYIDDSTLSGNFSGAAGGGLYNGCGAARLRNSTVSSNIALFSGGGIDGNGCAVVAFPYVELDHSTVAGNDAGVAGGGLYLRQEFMRLDSTLLGNNGLAGNCAFAAGVIADDHDNFDDDGTCGAGFGLLTGLDPALADNGGPTLTHALFADSSAIDTSGQCGRPHDQRGEPRDDFDCDGGAYEFETEPIVVDEVNCSLVDAVLAVETGLPTGGCVPPHGAESVLLTVDVTLTEPYEDGLGGVGLPLMENHLVLLGGNHTVARADDAVPFRFMASCGGCSWRLQDLTLSNFSVSGSSLPGEGGALFNIAFLYLKRVTLTGNAATNGGAIANYGVMFMDSCTVSNNTAAVNGGGIDEAGATTMDNSTVSGNSAGRAGGGIDVFGTLNVTNSTIAGNSAETTGGGIAFGGSGTTGGVAQGVNSQVNARNTLVANNGATGNCEFPLGDAGNNYDDDGSCGSGFANLTGLDPELTDNGGPTQTHALLPESSAIDAAGDCGLETDQRGAPRNDGSCDSGSFEFQCSIELGLEDGITWIAFSPNQGAFDLVTGDLATLLGNGGFADATCMGSYSASPADDSLADPPPGAGRYYLARGLVDCLGAGYGQSSLDPDPRSELTPEICP